MVQTESELKPWVGRFEAMGCPCEILLDTTDQAIGCLALDLAKEEAHRLEQKYSRYRAGSVVSRLNESAGQSIEIDEEAAALLDFAAECYALSDGLFDITTGVLRRGVSLAHVGWSRVRWQRPILELPAGFELDLGGIVKEYAADRIQHLLRDRFGLSVLVNLGGDISAAGDRTWTVGIENPHRSGHAVRVARLKRGAIATSGLTKRPGHILNPKTGTPVEGAPLSVTVFAPSCTEAGFWSTLAILKGDQAEAYLSELKLEYWCERG